MMPVLMMASLVVAVTLRTNRGFARQCYPPGNPTSAALMLLTETIIMAANINFFLLIVPLYITFSKLLAKKFCCFE